MKLAGDKLIYLTIGDRYEEPGATATDNIDGDITDKIVTSGKVDTSKEGSYQIKYIVKDKAGNLATATRTVIVKKPKDTIKPVIKLIGSNTLFINVGDKYRELGATAIDNVDGDITDKIQIVNGVNSSKTGQYTIFYKVRDSAGNLATAQEQSL